MRRAPFLVLALAALPLTACSGIKTTSWVPEGPRPPAPKTVALLPLIIDSASETITHAKYGPGFIVQTSVAVPLSPGEYKPAEAAMVGSLRRAFEPAKLVHPEEVEAKMGGARLESLEDGIREVARRTGAEGVLVVRIRNFNAKPASIENSQASGLTDLTLYDRQAKVRWSLSSSAVYSGAGKQIGNHAPSLADYVAYVGRKLEPEIRALN